MRTVKVYEESWPLHSPFVISRGSRSEARVVVVELEEEGIKASGECTPYPRYGESDASVIAQIMTIVPQLENGLSREPRATPLTVPCGILNLVGWASALRSIWAWRCRLISPRRRR